MTTREFELLIGRGRWGQAFRSKIGLRANKLHVEIFGAKAKTARDPYGNRVGYYPCGILEQAYRELSGSGSFMQPASTVFDDCA